jgi:hypothetical protein
MTMRPKMMTETMGLAALALVLASSHAIADDLSAAKIKPGTIIILGEEKAKAGPPLSLGFSWDRKAENHRCFSADDRRW